MALVGYGVLVGIPVISTAWLELLGFTEVQVGRVAGADPGGLSLGAIFVTYINIGAYRTYIELANLDAGVPDAWISSTLVWGFSLASRGALSPR
jgi:hypothetical protein